MAQKITLPLGKAADAVIKIAGIIKSYTGSMADNHCANLATFSPQQRDEYAYSIALACVINTIQNREYPSVYAEINRIKNAGGIEGALHSIKDVEFVSEETKL